MLLDGVCNVILNNLQIKYYFTRRCVDTAENFYSNLSISILTVSMSPYHIEYIMSWHPDMDCIIIL